MADLPLHTVISGAGEPVLMLHGWGHSMQNLWPLGELLEAQFQVHLIDLPGFGRSPKPPDDWGTVQYSERIAHYLDQQRLHSAHFIGHSFVGRVAMRLAARHPDRV